MNKEAAEIKLCFKKFGKDVENPFCEHDACMAWEPEYEERKKEIALDAEIPEGWVETHISIITEKRTIMCWIPLPKGDCGLKTKEPGCFYPG